MAGYDGKARYPLCGAHVTDAALSTIRLIQTFSCQAQHHDDRGLRSTVIRGLARLGQSVGIAGRCCCHRSGGHRTHGREHGSGQSIRHRRCAGADHAELIIARRRFSGARHAEGHRGKRPGSGAERARRRDAWKSRTGHPSRRVHGAQTDDPRRRRGCRMFRGAVAACAQYVLLFCRRRRSSLSLRSYRSSASPHLPMHCVSRDYSIMGR